MKRHKQPRIAKAAAFSLLREITSLIEASRRHVVSTANLTLVLLYWNVGRIITVDIQKNAKRAEYGEQLINNLGKTLAAKYGEGYSARNLRDMRRFFEAFEIWQAAPAKSFESQIREALPVTSSPDIRQAAPAKSPPKAICSPPASKSFATQILPPAAAESEGRITIDYLTQLPSKRLLSGRLEIYSRMLADAEPNQ